jgi:hypothetical protein
LNVKKRQETYEKKKSSLGCGLGQQFAFIKKQGKKIGMDNNLLIFHH